MMKQVREISISFPEAVEIGADAQVVLNTLVSLICNQWESKNPGYVMWAAGNGCSPIWEGGDIVGFREDKFSISCAAREAYDSERVEFTPTQVDAIRAALRRAREDAEEWRRLTRVSAEKLQEPIGTKSEQLIEENGN